jgi:hypothetical protein
MADFDLAASAQLLLDSFVANMEEQSIVLPDYQYVAPGNEIPWDCEQLTVHLARILDNFQGTETAFPKHHSLYISSAEFVFTLVRCVPVLQDGGKLPTAKELTTAAGVLLKDARAMRRAMERIDQYHQVVPRNVPVTVGPVNTSGPSGAFSAVVGTFTFQMIDEGWHQDAPPVKVPRRADGRD